MRNRILLVNTDLKQSPCDYSGDEITEYLSFGNEFAARSWAQVGEGLTV
jgi:hypothetical protein